MKNIFKIYWLLLVIVLLLGGALNALYATDDETDEEKKQENLVKYYSWEVVFIPDVGNPVSYYFDTKKQVKRYGNAMKSAGVVIYRDRSDFSSKWKRIN